MTGKINGRFGVGSVNGAQNDVPGAGKKLIAVVAEKATGNDFRLRLEIAGVLIDGDDGDDDAVFGKVFAFANDDFFDFFERAGINQDSSGGDRLAAEGSVFVELDAVAVLE